MSFPRIANTGRPGKIKHACRCGDTDKAFCGITIKSWFSASNKSQGFVLGNPANCRKCEEIVQAQQPLTPQTTGARKDRNDGK